MKDGAIRELSDIAARVDMRANGADPAAHPEATGKAVDAWAELFIAAIDERVAAHGKPADDAPRGDGGEAARACANMSPAPVPADAAEVARLRADLDSVRDSLGVAEHALDCGLTAAERREPAILVTCRSRGATCAACEIARLRRDGALMKGQRDIAWTTVADLRRRLKGAEKAIDERDTAALAIREAFGCRDGEATLAVAKRAGSILLAAEEACRSLLSSVRNTTDYALLALAAVLYPGDEALAHWRAGAKDPRDVEIGRLKAERDAYHATARANMERADRSDANMGRLLAAVDAIGNLLTVHGSIAYVVAEAQRIRDGGAPVDSRDAEIARLTRERDALVTAGVALRKAGLIANAAQWARFLALLPAETHAVTYGGPQPQSEAS